MSTSICDEWQSILDQNKIIVVGADFCPACVKAKSMLKKGNYPHLDYNIAGENESVIMQECILPQTRTNFIPQVFVNKKFIGGYSELRYMMDTKLLEDFKF